MQKLLSKRLVGIGLVVALLAFAVPALAQTNDWTPQTSPSPFDTPVTGLSIKTGGNLQAVTYGGGLTHGGTAGITYHSTNNGVTYVHGPAAPTGDDFTCTLWDGAAALYDAAWNSGLWYYDGVSWSNPSDGIAYVNQHVSALALDPEAPPVSATLPHVLFFGTWGGGIYTWDGVTFVQIFDPLNDFVNGAPATTSMSYITKLAVAPWDCTSNIPETVYAGTDGGGILVGTKDCTSGLWTWTSMNTGLASMHITALTFDSGTGLMWAGTQAGGVYYLDTTAGTTWTPMATDPAITTPVSDIVFSSFPNMIFLGTEGQGVYRYDQDMDTWHAINDAFSTTLGDLYVDTLAFDSGSGRLYAGTGNTGVAGTVGNVYFIDLTAPGLTFGPTFDYNVGDSPADTVGVGSRNNSPINWTTAITSGQLPPGLSTTVDNSNTPDPLITVGGTLTTDGCYIGTLTVYDSLLNRVDLPFDYTVHPDVVISVDPDPAPQGTLQHFTAAVTGATGTLDYAWDFGDGNTSTSPSPFHVYASPGTYTVTLTVTDNNPAGGCASVSTTATYSTIVYAKLTIIGVTATRVGSGAQFQFDVAASGGDYTSCAGYTYAWQVEDAVTHAVLFTSTVKNPLYTFAYTGDFLATVTVTDCSGASVTGTTSLNYNGPMSGTVTAQVNPAPTLMSVLFTATAQSTSVGATYNATFDWGDGSPVLPPMPMVVPPPPAAPFVQMGHQFMAPGTYTVAVTMTDGLGHSTVVTMQEVVYAAFTGVTASFTPDPMVCQLTSDQPVTMTLTPVGGLNPFKYTIDWGDGTFTTQTYADANAHSFTHTYAPGASYTINYYVTDSGNVQVT